MSGDRHTDSYGNHHHDDGDGSGGGNGDDGDRSAPATAIDQANVGNGGDMADNNGNDDNEPNRTTFLMRRKIFSSNFKSSSDDLKRWWRQNFEANRHQLRAASSNLFFRGAGIGECNKSDDNGNDDRFDIVITFARHCDIAMIEELGDHLESAYQGLITEVRIHQFANYNEKALYVGAEKALFETYLQSRHSASDGDDDHHDDDDDDGGGGGSSNHTYLGRYRTYFPYTDRLSSLQRQNVLIDLLKACHYSAADNCDNGPSRKRGELSKYLAPGDGPLVDQLQRHRFIDQLFSLHQGDDLERLKRCWVTKFFDSQPLNEICSYFGMRIAIYFAFIGFYTEALLQPMFFGVAITLFPYLMNRFQTYGYFPACNVPFLNCCLLFAYAVFNIFWSTHWLKRWNRKCQAHTSEWIKLMPDYHDTGLMMAAMMPDTESPGRKIFRYCVTFPIIAFCLIITFTVMFKIFAFQTWWDQELIESHQYPRWTGFVPKVSFAVILNIVNYLYYLIVNWLNEKERHGNMELKENHLIIKLFLFQFLNSFLPLFYIAFYLMDIEKLKAQLAAQLITRQVIGNFSETLWPFLKESIRLATRMFHHREEPGGDDGALPDCHRHRRNHLSQGELESCMYPYKSTFDDYLELVIQYGYVMLFAPVFPLAALCAFLNNVVEIRTDAFKLCYVFQRPFDQNRSTTLGVWSPVLDILSIIAIITNCALMVVTGQIGCLLPGFDSTTGSACCPVSVVLTGVLIEHLLLLIKWLAPAFYT